MKKIFLILLILLLVVIPIAFSNDVIEDDQSEIDEEIDETVISDGFYVINSKGVETIEISGEEVYKLTLLGEDGINYDTQFVDYSVIPNKIKDTQRIFDLGTPLFSYVEFDNEGKINSLIIINHGEMPLSFALLPIKGDLDETLDISIIDVRLLLQAFIDSSSEIEWSDRDLAIMDMDEDNQITIVDVRLLLQEFIDNPNEGILDFEYKYTAIPIIEDDTINIESGNFIQTSIQIDEEEKPLQVDDSTIIYTSYITNNTNHEPLGYAIDVEMGIERLLDKSFSKYCYAVYSPTDENCVAKYIFISGEPQIIETQKESGEEFFEESGDISGEIIAEVSGDEPVVSTLDRIHFISHRIGNINEKGEAQDRTGDAILLESNGHFAMIDTGNNKQEIGQHVVNYLKEQGVETLDFVMITHMHTDHAGNFERIIASGIKVDSVWMKYYDIPAYNENYIANPDANGIDRGLAVQVEDGNDAWILNKALAWYRRIMYLSNYSAYKDNVASIKYVSNDPEGTAYTWQDMSLKLCNNTRSTNARQQENFNSIYTLITVNGHKIFMSADAYDTKQFNEASKKVGKVEFFKVPHHGGVNTALMTKKYKGDKINKESGTPVASTAMASLKPEYNVITSSTEQIRKTRSEKNLANGKMAVDVLTYGTKMYVDYNPNSLIIDFTNPGTYRFIRK